MRTADARGGATLDFSTGETTREAAAIMIDRARRRQVRDSVSVLASLGYSLNVGAGFVPFVGEAR